VGVVGFPFGFLVERLKGWKREKNLTPARKASLEAQRRREEQEEKRKGAYLFCAETGAKVIVASTAKRG
jgi:hypothetical protein